MFNQNSPNTFSTPESLTEYRDEEPLAMNAALPPEIPPTVNTMRVIVVHASAPLISLQTDDRSDVESEISTVIDEIENNEADANNDEIDVSQSLSTTSISTFFHREITELRDTSDYDEKITLTPKG